MKANGVRIKFRDALCIKSAEFWLELGQPGQALLELQRLSGDAKAHPWAFSVFVCALKAARALA